MTPEEMAAHKARLEIIEKLGWGPSSIAGPDWIVQRVKNEKKVLELQNCELRKVAVGLLQHVYEGGCPDEYHPESRAENCPVCKILGPSEKRSSEPLICSVCKGPREEAAWSGICGNCQDLGHERKGL